VVPPDRELAFLHPLPPRATRSKDSGRHPRAPLARCRRNSYIAGAIMGAVQRFTVTIEAPTWEDFQEIELPQLPGEGDAIETRYGTCIVTRAELSPDSGQYAGKIVCRLP
jgi:hypothetical protein